MTGDRQCNTLAGEEGATLRELMDRIGHASTRAALIYQHRTTHRDMPIADEISKAAPSAAPRPSRSAASRPPGPASTPVFPEVHSQRRCRPRLLCGRIA